MSRLLPFVFLISIASLFGISWIVFDINPDTAPWFIFTLIIFLIFISVAGFLGLLFFFARTKFIKKFSTNWYVITSFKMSGFIAFFIAIASTLALLELITLYNLILAGIAVSLFAIYSFLEKNK